MLGVAESGAQVAGLWAPERRHPVPAECDALHERGGRRVGARE